MPCVTVSEKGQVVIPARIRTLLGITAGTRLEMIIQADGIKVLVEPDRKARKASSCIGVAGYSGPPIDVADMDVARFAHSP